MCNKNLFMSLVLVRHEFFLGKTFCPIPIWLRFSREREIFYLKNYAVLKQASCLFVNLKS